MEIAVCGPELLRAFSKFWAAPETRKEKIELWGAQGQKFWLGQVDDHFLQDAINPEVWLRRYVWEKVPHRTVRN